jgi:hypothetical protein
MRLKIIKKKEVLVENDCDNLKILAKERFN